MKRKIFGIKISTLLSAFVCLLVAFVVWMIVKYQTATYSSDVALYFLNKRF